MNETLAKSNELSASGFHPVVAWGLAAALGVLWWLTHRWTPRLPESRPVRAMAGLGRIVIGTLALWAFWQAAAGHLLLETTWPLPLHGLLGAAAIEIVLGLYALEKRIVPERI
ncbi:MAG: hypothetical protein JWL81_304, partial [Verrucomicrobiales bacterium]|nr:hypothetical protein [Verrucomicrobiales bacterium]